MEQAVRCDCYGCTYNKVYCYGNTPDSSGWTESIAEVARNVNVKKGIKQMNDERDVVRQDPMQDEINRLNELAADESNRAQRAEAKLKEVTDLIEQVKVHNKKLVEELEEAKKANAHAAAMLNAVRFVVR